ncbi:MAG: fused MFS/spermidine synthase, partial [Elusimicrobia bacterium]|nr:fused MFS/spermidine synthase [Elusimicrobiota bacterium]
RLAALLALFFLSGAAGLVYEVVWLRLLVRAFGSTTVATSHVLAVFMGGLALGAWAAGGRARAARSPLKAYAALELALGLAAAAATLAASRLPAAFAALAPAGPIDSAPATVVRFVLAALVLLVPTAAMGASLPLVAEHCAREGASGADRPGLLYGANTLGAVLGVLASGFWALGALGERRTALLAVLANLLVAAGAAWLARRPPAPAAPKPPAAFAPAADGLSPRAVAWAMAVSGFCALGLEVLWTRMLVLLLGNSVYAFSAMLACYLAGTALGSLACAARLASVRRLGQAFGALQALAGLLIVVSLEVYRWQGLARTGAEYLYSPIQSGGDFAALFASSLGVVLPVTFVYGLLFPVAVRLCDAGAAAGGVAKVYGYNTVGSVAGSLACAFLLIPVLGTRLAAYAFALGHVAVGAWPALRRGAFPRFAAACAALALGAAWLRPDPFLDIVRARLARRAPGAVVSHREGSSSTTTVFASARETLLLLNGIIVSGKGDLGRFMAHFPLALRPKPGRALVICLGAGNTFRAAVEHGVTVDLAELEPTVVETFSDLWPDHERYLRHPSVRVFVNDGRNVLLTTRERYDAVIIDGTPPIFSAGTVNLYTREFVELARSRLAPGGILALWVPLPCFESDFWMIARNFVDAFPHTLAWAQPTGKLGGILLLGSREPFLPEPGAIDRRAVERGLSAANPWLNRSLLDPSKLVPDAALRAKASRYPPVTDDLPLTEFPLPLFVRRARLQSDPGFALLAGR